MEPAKHSARKLAHIDVTRVETGYLWRLWLYNVPIAPNDLYASTDLCIIYKVAVAVSATTAAAAQAMTNLTYIMLQI